MHRLILASATFRQSADNPAATQSKADPDNRLLWRFNRRRLEAEVIRDGVLLVSGRLNPERGGPSVFPPLPQELSDLAKAVPIGGIQWEPNEREADARRRSVYIFQRRSLPVPIMASLDATVFNESCERRSITTTPLQALSMMNGDLINEESVHLAARVRNGAGEDRQAQISRLFEIVLNRPPEAEEMERFYKFSGSLEALCRVALNASELFYLE